MSSSRDCNLREYYDTIVHHGLQEFDAGIQTTQAGYFVVFGSYYCVKGIKEICSGNVKNGLMKGALGAVAVAGGLYRLITTWQEITTDANRTYCRQWIGEGGILNISAQECNAFDCTVPARIRSVDYSKCKLLEGDAGLKGFANVYEMKKASLGYEYAFIKRLRQQYAA